MANREPDRGPARRASRLPLDQRLDPDPKLATPWRVVGLLTALMCLGALLIGPRLLSMMPKMVAGTVLFYVGLGLMFDWLYRTWSRMHPADYLVLFVVFVFVAFVGLIEGLGIGIALGLVIFVLRYSRIDAARNTASGAKLRSNVERAEAAKHALKRVGDSTFIVTLQGYIFFGTSHRLLNLIRQRIFATEGMPVRFLVLDFHLVSGLDSSAAASFTKLVRYSKELGFNVLFAGTSEHIVAMFRREGLFGAGGDALQTFDDLDRALEWTENRLLEMEKLVGSGDIVSSGCEQRMNPSPGPNRFRVSLRLFCVAEAGASMSSTEDMMSATAMTT